MGFLTLPASDARTIAASLTAPERFATIFDRHFDAVHAYLARRVEPAQADDLASATFVVAFERRRHFRPQATSARPWLYGIAANLLREHWRAQERGIRLQVAVAAERVPATEAAWSPERDRLDEPLSRALAGLDPDQREVLLLTAWEELSYAEVAVALDIPVGTVRSRLARARARLIAELDATPARSRLETHEETT